MGDAPFSDYTRSVSSNSNITIDSNVIQNSNNAVAGGAVYTEVQNTLNAIPNVDTALAQNSLNPIANDAVYNAIQTINLALSLIPSITIDQYIQNSANPVQNTAINSVLYGQRVSLGELANPVYSNVVVLNGTGNTLTAPANLSFTVKPVRNVANNRFLLYNDSTGEITYDTENNGHLILTGFLQQASTEKVINYTFTNNFGVQDVIWNTPTFSTRNYSLKTTYFASLGAVVITSDDRLKHHEIDLSNFDCIDIVKQLRPKLYKKTNVMLDASYNGDLSGIEFEIEAGLIAQEVNQIQNLKFAVDQGDETNPYHLDYNSLSMYHLQATKILIKEIEDLKARLAKAGL